MPDGTNGQSNQSHDTQLHAIRDLMLAAARRGAWLTLDEIAELTAIGEASISAQLRHLRKWQHGRHLVEKRRRPPHPVTTESAGEARFSRKRRIVAGPVMWEYRVLPSAGYRTIRDLPKAIGDVVRGPYQEAEEVNDAEARD